MKKIKQRLQSKQKLNLKRVIVLSCFGSALLILFLSIFQLSNSESIKAETIEITHVEEQVFVNDKSIDAPIINVQQKTGPNSLLIQSIKEDFDSSTTKNE